MELNLHKLDYFQVGITNNNCMKLLPPSQSGTQKIVIGDKNGKIQIFSVKGAQGKSLWREKLSSSVSMLALGGAVGKLREKIFVSTGTDVLGYSKAGKNFLQFDTNLTEEIRSIYVEGSELFVGGSYTYQRFTNLKESDYLLCPDEIVCVLCLPMDKVPEATVILACRDRVLRVLKDGSLIYEVEVPGIPSVMILNSNNGADSGEEVIYGTSDGKFGLVQIDSISPVHRWEVMNPDSLGGITCMDHFQLTDGDLPDLIVGRDDGTIEVYTCDEIEKPQLKCTHTSNESISAVQGGIVGGTGFPEIVVCTYSGWVFGLTTEPIDKGIDSSGSVLLNSTITEKTTELKQEVEKLQEKVTTERQRYQEAALSDTAVSAVPLFDIKEKFQLNPEEAAYNLSVECQSSIDNVLLQSDVPIDLLDVEKNSAVVSYSACKIEDGNYLLATYRCQANTTRIEVKIRSIEGQYGTVSVYVTPRTQPKVCQMREFRVKPLSLHRRTHSFDNKKPLNTLRLSGNFSLAELHSWVSFCLPETPDKPNISSSSDGGQSAMLTYESTFLKTQLECQYRKGEATFRSDNLSTISILKDVLSKEATKRKINLNINFDVNDSSIEHTLGLIHPKMEELLLLAKKVQLIEPLRELVLNEPEGKSILSDEYGKIIDEADDLQKAYKKQPCHLERLYGMITDLYIDKFKFRGQNVRSRVPSLLDILDDYKFETLVNFFNAE